MHKFNMRLLSLFRPACALCHLHPAAAKQAVCRDCQRDLPWCLQPVLVQQLSVFALFHYAWPVDRMIHLLKYQQHLEFLNSLTDGLSTLSPPPVDAIVAVPMSTQRLRERGFNQAQLLASACAKQWQLPLWNGLTRTRHTVQQQRLNQTERYNNLAGAFSTTATPPQRLLLVDDVLTTGSTLRSVADCLIDSGSQHIEGLVLASAHERR